MPWCLRSTERVKTTVLWKTKTTKKSFVCVCVCLWSLLTSYPVLGEKEESKVSFRPRASWTEKKFNGWISNQTLPQVNLGAACFRPKVTWSSRVISVPSVLSVFHFSVNISPYSTHLYLVSKLPLTLLVSEFAEPELVNSWRGKRKLYTSLCFLYSRHHWSL